MSQRRFTAFLLGSFAALAVILAAIGVHGLLSYNVARRRQEIGIRMALGAGRGAVLGLILREGLVIITAGLIVGLAGAVARTRLLQALLFGVSPTDPLTFVVVAGVLTAVALVATLLPARRAARSTRFLPCAPDEVNHVWSDHGARLLLRAPRASPASPSCALAIGIGAATVFKADLGGACRANPEPRTEGEARLRDGASPDGAALKEQPAERSFSPAVSLAVGSPGQCCWPRSSSFPDSVDGFVRCRRVRGRRRTPQPAQAARGRRQRSAARILPVVEDPHELDRYIAVSQVGITLSSLILGAYGQAAIAPAVVPLVEGIGVKPERAASTSAIIVLLTLTVLAMIVGELVPKSLALQDRPARRSHGAADAVVAAAVFVGHRRPQRQRRAAAEAAARAVPGTTVHSPEEIELLIAESRDGGLLEPAGTGAAPPGAAARPAHRQPADGAARAPGRARRQHPASEVSWPS